VTAQFHRAHHTIKKRKARPEVQLARIHLLDYTVLAFVIIGRGRREQAGWLLFPQDSAPVSTPVSIKNDQWIIFIRVAPLVQEVKYRKYRIG